MSGNRKTYNVFFLCTGNSARSLMAEAYLNSLSDCPFKGYSAGSHPTGAPNPFSIVTLTCANVLAEGLRSKSWDEFEGEGAPQMDFVLTVCDNAAGETCPIWPGHPMTAHWPFPDPAACEGSEADVSACFQDVFGQIRGKIDLLAGLPVAALDELLLKQELDRIGKASSGHSTNQATK